MALASQTAGNAALNGLAGTGSTNYMTHVSLHTSTGPGTAGGNEYAGVTRQSVTWNAAASGQKTNSGLLTFTTDGLTPVTSIGTWNQASGGTYCIGATLGSNVTATSITIAAGAITLSAS